jgi:hypothetical protein
MPTPRCCAGLGRSTMIWAAGLTRPGRLTWLCHRARLRPLCFQHGTVDFGGYYDELVRAANVSLPLHASVAELALERIRAGHRVELHRDDGSRSFVRPQVEVLAAGGIEYPRLLLLSRRFHRRGLGNDRDLVGRFFAERLSARTGYIVPAPPDLIGSTGFYPIREAAPGVHVQRGLRVVDAVQREYLLNCAFFL